MSDEEKQDVPPEFWQGRGQILFVGEEVATLFHWPENPPTMTVIDEDGNEVELT